jgi:hypothetical protein
MATEKKQALTPQEAKADRIRKVKNKYHLEDRHIIEDKGLTVIRKIGIMKIQQRERIRYKIIHQDIKALGTIVGTEDAVYLTGRGQILNALGYVTGEINATASANPFNCTYNYRMEVAEARLRSRIVLELAGLSDFMSEDELNLNVEKTDHPSSMHEDDKLINEALGRLGKSNR